MIRRCQHCETWNHSKRGECRKCYQRLGSLSPSDAAYGSASLVWDKTKDDPEIYTAEASPSYRYFLLGACGKYIACYSSGTTYKVIGYLHAAGTKMETMEAAKERCERHRQNEKCGATEPKR